MIKPLTDQEVIERLTALAQEYDDALNVESANFQDMLSTIRALAIAIERVRIHPNEDYDKGA